MFLDTDATRRELTKRAAGASIDVAVPYLTRDGMKLLLDAKPAGMRLLTQVREADVVSGFMSLAALRDVLEAGFSIRALPQSQRLHAKVFAFTDHALVGSANLTGAGLGRNVEASALLTASAAKDAAHWFARNWLIGTKVGASDIDKFENELGDLTKTRSSLPGRILVPAPIEALLAALHLRPDGRISSDRRWLVCNSGRNYARPQRAWEDFMLRESVAAAWEDFQGLVTVQSIRPGDVVVLYGNGSGVVAAGIACGRHTTVPTTSAGFWVDGPKSTRWEVPVDWVHLTRPIAWNSVPRGTFSEPGPKNIGKVLRPLFNELQERRGERG